MVRSMEEVSFGSGVASMLVAVVFFLHLFSPIVCSRTFIIFGPKLIIKDPNATQTTESTPAEVTEEEKRTVLTNLPGDSVTQPPEEEDKGSGGEDDDTQRPPPQFKDNLPPPSLLEPCDKATNQGCNISNYERCVLIRERAGRCDCLPGYARGRDAKTCLAIKYYMSQLATLNEYTKDLEDQSSSIHRKMEYQVREALFQALLNSKLRSIAVDVGIQRFVESKEGSTILVDFEISISRSYAPEVKFVQQDLREGISNILVDSPGGYTVLDGTEVKVDRAESQELVVTAPIPCSDPIMNYCDENAICLATVRSFSCRCKSGFTDVSPSQLEAPGEKCRLECGCKNGATCKFNEEQEKYCECPSWYIGVHCEIDGKVLLIGIASIIGGLLLIGIICCACCIWRMKLKKRSSFDTSSVASVQKYPEEKVPRSWMDTWRYYSFSSPGYNNSYPQMGYPSMMRSHKPPTSRDPPPMYPMQMMIPRPHVLAQPPPRYYRPDTWYWSPHATTDA